MGYWTAVWAAVAASCSAASALLMLRLHHVNRRDSVRPELVVYDYELVKRVYGGNRPTLAAITFRLENAGVGTAFDTRLDGWVEDTDVSRKLKEAGERVNTARRLRPLILPGKNTNDNDYIEFYWPLLDDRFDVKLEVYYFDLHGRCYRTTYFFKIEPTDDPENSCEGHGLDVYRRETARMDRRATAKILSDLWTQGIRYTSAPMGYYFDLAAKELEEERRERKDA